MAELVKTPTRDSTLPNRIKTGKVSAEDTMKGLAESSFNPGVDPGGSRDSSSARPRDASKASFVQGCFCHKESN
jgi:hypothetical protein